MQDTADGVGSARSWGALSHSSRRDIVCTAPQCGRSCLQQCFAPPLLYLQSTEGLPGPPWEVVSAGEAFSWCYSSLLPFLGSGVELVPFNPPHVGPGRFLGGLKRGDSMQETGWGGLMSDSCARRSSWATTERLL